MQLLCVMLSDECQLSLLSKLMSTIVNKAAKTTRAANMDAKRYEVCQSQLLTSSGAREPFCNRGPRSKNQVLSCNMRHWLSPRPLNSCWLLMQWGE